MSILDQSANTISVLEQSANQMPILGQSANSKPILDQSPNPIPHGPSCPNRTSRHLRAPIVKTVLAPIGSALARIDTGHDNRRSIGEQSSYLPSNKYTIWAYRSVLTEEHSHSPFSASPICQSYTNRPIINQSHNPNPTLQYNANPRSICQVIVNPITSPTLCISHPIGSGLAKTTPISAKSNVNLRSIGGPIPLLT